MQQAAQEMQNTAAEYADSLGELLCSELAQPPVTLDEKGTVAFEDGYLLGGSSGTMRDRLARAAESDEQREHVLAAVQVLHSMLYRIWERAKWDRPGGVHPSENERYALVPTMLDTVMAIEVQLQTTE